MSNPAADEVTAASQRLQAIVVKLRLLAQDNRQTGQAIAEFEKILKQHKEADRRTGIYVAGCVGLLIVLCVAAIIIPMVFN